MLQNSSADGIYIARHVLLKCGIPVDKPALHVNRLCGSGFQSIVNGAQVGTCLLIFNNIRFIRNPKNSNRYY